MARVRKIATSEFRESIQNKDDSKSITNTISSKEQKEAKINKGDSKSITNTTPPKEEKKIETKTNREIDYSYPEEDYDEDDNIPDIINITYKFHVDIILIHNTIRKKFAIERGKYEDYKKQLEEIEVSFEYDTTINELRNLEETRIGLLEKIDEIKSGEKWEIYISKAKPFLEEFKNIFHQHNRNIVRIGKKIETEETKINAETKLKLIKSYLDIASEFININATRLEKLSANCPVCEKEFKDFEVDEDAGICSCPRCGWYRENLAKFSCNKDNGRTSSNNKNDYEDRENFYRSIIRFACKQNKNFHPNLEEDLDEYFVKIGVGKGEDIKAQPLIKGRKKGVDFQMMIKALTYLSKPTNKLFKYREIYSDYYEDGWLIMVNYWGFLPHDIMGLVPDLMDIYDRTQEEYIAMSLTERGGRNASLNTQYRLLVELLALGYPCSKVDFKIQKESLEIHQKLWRKMCQKTGVLFCEII